MSRRNINAELAQKGFETSKAYTIGIDGGLTDKSGLKPNTTTEQSTKSESSVSKKETVELESINKAAQENVGVADGHAEQIAAKNEVEKLEPEQETKKQKGKKQKIEKVENIPGPEKSSE